MCSLIHNISTWSHAGKKCCSLPANIPDEAMPVNLATAARSAIAMFEMLLKNATKGWNLKESLNRSDRIDRS
jgi:hypothetical protein